jgi:hypothetical protein
MMLTGKLSQQKNETKKYYQKHFHHTTDICCFNSYLLNKNQEHFQDGISVQTHRKCDFEASQIKERPGRLSKTAHQQG